MSVRRQPLQGSKLISQCQAQLVHQIPKSLAFVNLNSTKRYTQNLKHTSCQPLPSKSFDQFNFNSPATSSHSERVGLGGFTKFQAPKPCLSRPTEGHTSLLSSILFTSNSQNTRKAKAWNFCLYVSSVRQQPALPSIQNQLPISCSCFFFFKLFSCFRSKGRKNGSGGQCDGNPVSKICSACGL